MCLFHHLFWGRSFCFVLWNDNKSVDHIRTNFHIPSSWTRVFQSHSPCRSSVVRYRTLLRLLTKVDPTQVSDTPSLPPGHRDFWTVSTEQVTSRRSGSTGNNRVCETIGLRTSWPTQALASGSSFGSPTPTLTRFTQLDLSLLHLSRLIINKQFRKKSVYVRCVDLSTLPCSLSSHWHSYKSLYVSLTLSFHNKQYIQEFTQTFFSLKKIGKEFGWR
jgi:hypothetical protein